MGLEINNNLKITKIGWIFLGFFATLRYICTVENRQEAALKRPFVVDIARLTLDK